MEAPTTPPSPQPSWRPASVLVCVLAGFMVTVAALAAQGSDLRADRNASLRDLVASQTRRNEQLRAEVEALTAQVQQLSEAQGSDPQLPGRVRDAGLAASTEPVSGPGVRVKLTDAPLDVKPEGVDDDLLVIHQQDIQAVVNALWAGGAEAMTIQGQRVVATTGIKCVGNSVVLHGVPYAPPYVVEAIGPADAMEKSLATNRPVQILRDYAEVYGLGYEQQRVDSLELPGFVGSLGVTLAEPVR